MAIRAVISIACMFFYPPIEHFLGAVKCYQTAMFIWPLVVISPALLNKLTQLAGQSTWFFNAVLMCYFFVWSMASLTWSK